MATKITFPSWNGIVKVQLDKMNILRGTYQSNGIIKKVRNMEDFHYGAKQFDRLGDIDPESLEIPAPYSEGARYGTTRVAVVEHIGEGIFSEVDSCLFGGAVRCIEDQATRSEKVL
jgi:hypothetical protein